MIMADLSLHENRIRIVGDLKVTQIASLWQRLQLLLRDRKDAELILDLAAVTGIDSAGVALLDNLQDQCQSRGIAIHLENIPLAIHQAIASFSIPRLAPEIATPVPGFFEALGDKFYRLRQDLVDFLLLTTDIFYWSVVGLFRRKNQRAGSFVQQSLLIGVGSLKILALLTFLIGLVLALQSAAQLRQLGADIFVADLIGIAMLREMGPIMTAVILAGRSGSAIASEIATMVVTEEIDALRTMALNPVRYVMVAKFHAITVAMPLLTILADLIGIFGGLVIGVVYLQLSATAFINELLTVVILKDVLTGLAKSLVFAWIIVIVGCYYGMQVKGGAEGVGKATTASVVASIFLIIVADSILGLIFYFE